MNNIQPGEYILQSAARGDGNELENLLLEEALQLVAINDLNVSIERKPSDNHFANFGAFYERFFSTFFSLPNQDNKKEQAESKPDEAAKQPKEENSSAEGSDELEAILENNLKQDDFDFDLNSPLSILLDDTDELDLLNDMMIQPSSTHFQHPRQPSQNYAHCVNSYRQNGYQVRIKTTKRIRKSESFKLLGNTICHAGSLVDSAFDSCKHIVVTQRHRLATCFHVDSPFSLFSKPKMILVKQKMPQNVIMSLSVCVC